MQFIVSAILLAKICTTQEDCRIVRVAEFGNGAIGEQFCQGTAGMINEVGGQPDSEYFCVAPGADKQVLNSSFRM